jgi:MYXO-CTERM domain-containing protein
MKKRLLLPLMTLLVLVATPALALADGAWWPKCNCDVTGTSSRVPLALGMFVAGGLALAVARSRRTRRPQ